MREIPVVYEDAPVHPGEQARGGEYRPERGQRLFAAQLGWKGRKAITSHSCAIASDNQTSGLCLIARTSLRLRLPGQLLKPGRLSKISMPGPGTPDPDEAVLKAYLSKDARMARVTVSEKPNKNSKQIITAYKVLEAGEISRLEEFTW